jgi:hypothetical protein
VAYARREHRLGFKDRLRERFQGAGGDHAWARKSCKFRQRRGRCGRPCISTSPREQHLPCEGEKLLSQKATDSGLRGSLGDYIAIG